MEKKIYLFLAEGFEEVEALAVVDILRRSGLGCTTASIMETKEVAGSHQIIVHADCLLDEVDFSSADMLILPGGMPGTTNLGTCKPLTEQLKVFHEKGKMLGAICAAPGVLGQNGILKGKKAACYPGCEKNLTGADVVCTEVAVDGNVITSRGMGTAIPFGLAIVEHFLGKEVMEKLKKSIVYQQA
jgi:4-methyl-5(b-hydroxyethyl)-thiazole monophosphate biosynthesis